MWPLKGSCLHTELGEFMLNKLCMGGGYVSALKFQDIEIIPVQKNRPDRCPDEAIVVFPNKEMRDRVRSHASNLAKLPASVKAGVRMEIPDFLQANFRALEQVGYRIKQGNQRARRNILFDDDRLDLALDVKPDDGLDWVRILPAQARRAKAKAPPPPESSRGFGPMTLDDDSITSLMDNIDSDSGSDEDDFMDNDGDDVAGEEGGGEQEKGV